MSRASIRKHPIHPMLIVFPVGLWILNLIVVALFIFNLGIRYNPSATTELFGVILSIGAIATMAVSGWLGGSMVYIHHVGVQPARESKEQERRIA